MSSKMSRENFERLAEGRARGLTRTAAALAAGYAPSTTSFFKAMRSEAFKERVRELENLADMAPVIRQLLEAAKKAVEIKDPDAATLTAVTRALVEAARLKMLLPESAAPERRSRRPAGMLDDATLNAWAARYGAES